MLIRTRLPEASQQSIMCMSAGEENLDFVESLRQSSIKLLVTRHEQTAGFMAATMGRLTGKAGVALATLGPGATNFTTAASYGHLGVYAPDRRESDA